MEGHVHTPAYVGRERRSARRATRMFDRRRTPAEDLAPPLSRALRQLSMRIIDMRDETSLDAFREQLDATHALALHRGEQGVAAELARLIRMLDGAGCGHAREAAEGQIRSAISRLVS